MGYVPGRVIEPKTRPGDTKEPTRETRINPVGGADGPNCTDDLLNYTGESVNCSPHFLW